MKKIKLARPVLLLCLALFLCASLVYAITAPSRIVFKNKKKADVIFSCAGHSKKFDCSKCHPELFAMKRNGTAFTMEDISAGKKCGTCHNGTVSFAVKNCVRCHVPPKKPAVKTGCPGDCTKCTKCE
ncbi:MAG: cytochrome c3 family protein [Candidatus Eremiobacteraeota bacterium]|nr:cytochrome c3 family protein [Candidatus Eremiobacteraeota bacterium]